MNSGVADFVSSASFVRSQAAVRVVNIGEMVVSDQPSETIKTYALGSCLGVTIYDPVAKVGGLIHLQLPESSIDPKRAVFQPFLFVDTGLPKFFHAAYAAGARKERLTVKAAGAACIHEVESNDIFQIGKRNFLAVRKLLWKNGILLKAYEVGGSSSRTLTLDVSTGETAILSAHGLRRL